MIRTALVLALSLAAFAAPVAGPQASLVLSDSSAEFAQFTETGWDLEKAGAVDENGAVVWQVAVVRGATTSPTIQASGFVRVKNSGEGAATIGNIVVNLQRKSGKSWKTVSSDIADATSGDAATQAKIVKAASSEGLSAFVENTASGSLSFTDADSNTVFSMVPQPVLAGGETVSLLFTARYDNSVLQIPAGESLRLEVIVTFGNSGARGGSGASATNVDINGNGVVDADEANVRSVPTRITRALPEVEACNDEVLLTDTALDVTTTGTVAWEGFLTDIGEGTGIEVLSDSALLGVAVQVTSGSGTITNTATLQGSGGSVTVNGPLDPLTGEPLYSYTFVTGSSFVLTASATVVIEEPAPDTFGNGSFFTYTQGGWGATPNGNNPASKLANNFAAVYPNSLQVGGNKWMKFTNAAAVSTYLPAGGPANKLTANLTNPTSSSAGVFGGQVVALRLNVDFSAAGVTAGTSGKFGDAKYVDAGSPLNGLTVAEILALAEVALGGGGLPDGMTFASFNGLATNLNESFDNGVMTAWAAGHLQP